MNLSTLPDLRAAEAPDAPAVADDTINLNNTQFLTPCGEQARVVDDEGCPPGTWSRSCCPTGWSFVVAMFAAWRLGAAVTPINPRWRRRGGYQIDDAAAKVVIADDAAADRRAGRDAPTDDLDRGEPTALDDPPSDRDDALALLIYTSGTTGRPEGRHARPRQPGRHVPHGHRRVRSDRDDHSLLILPLFHVNGIVRQHAVAAAGRRPRDGRRPVRARRRSSAGSSRAAPPTSPPCRRSTRCCAVLPAEVRPDTSSLRSRVCGAAPASVELLTEFETALRHPASSRATGCPRAPAPGPATRSTGRASPARSGCRCPGRRVRMRPTSRPFRAGGRRGRDQGRRT